MNLPYQKHSETSRQAAEQNETATKVRNEIYKIIIAAGTHGKTNDEISAMFGKTGSYFSPRLIELERDGLIIKTDQTRKTRNNRNAYIYVDKKFWSETMGRAVTKKLKVNLTSNDDDVFRELADALKFYAKKGRDDGLWADTVLRRHDERLGKAGWKWS